MSVESRIRRDKGGDPVLVITVTGVADVYRIGEVFTRQQTDFVSIAQRVMRYLYRQLGRSRFTALDESMNSGMMLKGKWHSRPRRDK